MSLGNTTTKTLVLIINSFHCSLGARVNNLSTHLTGIFK